MMFSHLSVLKARYSSLQRKTKDAKGHCFKNNANEKNVDSSGLLLLCHYDV